jgi:hypothetical protein
MGFPSARRGGDLVAYARAVMLSPSSVIVEVAAATGKALSSSSALSRGPLDSVGVEELRLGAVGLRSRACETLEEADLEGSAVNRTFKSGAPGSSSVGSSR